MHGKMGTVKDYTKLHKRIAVLVTIGVVAAVGIVIAIFVIWKGKSSQSQASYREYTVAQGNVTVGTTESGTVALDSSSVTFPVACKIDTVLVKAGTTVKKGQALVKLDLDSVQSGSSDTRQKLEAAKISLQSALNDQKAKLDAAKVTYESSKYLAQSAPVTRQLTEGELQQNITSAQLALKNDQTSLTDYQALQQSWSTDYAKLQTMKKWMEDADNAKTSYTTQLSKFKDDNSVVLNTISSLKSDMETKKTTYLQAEYNNADEASDDEDLYTAAKNAYTDYMSDVGQTILDQQTDLENKVAQVTAEYTNYSSAYNDYNSTFSDKYKSSATSLSKSDIDSKVASLQATVKTDEYNLEKAQKTAAISSFSAQQQEKTDMNTASAADDTYNLTVNQLEEAVTAAQDSYDTLNNEMTDIDSALSGNGVITAPSDGIVAQIDFVNGESVTANTAMMTISKTDSITMTVDVSEDDITNVSIGQDATISLSAYDNSSISGVVESITAEPARSGSSSVTYAVVIRSKEGTNSIGTVYDGMSGEVTVVQHSADNVLNINNRAITFKNGVSTVLVKNSDGTQTTKQVKTGFSNGTSVEITSGLKAGDTVLVESGVTA